MSTNRNNINEVLNYFLSIEITKRIEWTLNDSTKKFNFFHFRVFISRFKLNRQPIANFIIPSPDKITFKSDRKVSIMF